MRQNMDIHGKPDPPGKVPAWSTQHAVVVGANWYQFRARDRIRQPRVESRMLLWCKQGKGQVAVDGNLMSMKVGDYVTMPWPHRVDYRPDPKAPFFVGAVHLVPHHDRRHPVKFLVAHDRNDPLADCSWRRDIALPGLAPVTWGQLAAVPGFEHLLSYVVCRFTHNRSPDPHEMRQLGGMVLDELQRSIHAQPESDIHEPAIIRRATQWVRDHVEDRISMKDIAQALGCSPSTLQRLFRRHLRLSPQQWIARVKLERATDLIRSTRMPLMQIGQKIGIDDPFYFSRWFRNLTGQSPRQARQRMDRL